MLLWKMGNFMVLNTLPGFMQIYRSLNLGTESKAKFRYMVF